MPLSELGASESPKKWRFTWEAQAHIPILRLFLFCPNTYPFTECVDLKVDLNVGRSLLLVSWFEVGVEVSLGVPIPKVLIDVESPVNVRALDDHVEVKLRLLVPVDHPIVSNFDSVFGSPAEESCPQNVLQDELQPLSMDSDCKSLSSHEGLHFYCRNCSTKLTRVLRIFEEMPSVNWREVADNWFGTCCCSFGGVSERLVTSYAKSYGCAAGVCLLDTTAVILCIDDLVGCTFPDSHDRQKNESGKENNGNNDLAEEMQHNGSKHEGTVLCENQDKVVHGFDGNLSCKNPRELDAKPGSEAIEEVTDYDSVSSQFSALVVTEKFPSIQGCCVDANNHMWNYHNECCPIDVSKTSIKHKKPGTAELFENQKTFLNGFLGNVFMARSSNISKDVLWNEFLCPHCSCFLGAYPSDDSRAPLDGQVRLFKSYISTCLPAGGSSDLFRKYTFKRMFTHQLLESAEDELSFRTVIRDLQTKSPILQIILLNPSLWCYTGGCLNAVEMVSRINMYPAIKVLFSNCQNSSEFQLSVIDEWVTKNQADEVYIFESQINELIEALESSRNTLPQANAFLQGFSVSSLRR